MYKCYDIDQIGTLEKCPCEMDVVDVDLSWGDYTNLRLEKNEYGVKLAAYGEGQASWEPIYCPLCGRRLKK